MPIRLKLEPMLHEHSYHNHPADRARVQRSLHVVIPTLNQFHAHRGLAFIVLIARSMCR